jgi:hypothetical protein
MVEGVTSVREQECRIGFVDVTKRKMAEEALRLAEAVAEKLRLEKAAAATLRLAEEAAETFRIEKEIADATARAKNQFFVNMSHELHPDDRYPRDASAHSRRRPGPSAESEPRNDDEFCPFPPQDS